MIKLTNFTHAGMCSNCGECCSDFLSLSKEEIKVIDEYIKKHKVEQHNKGSLNSRCPFRNDFLRKCDIYEARPYICRVFKCDTQPEEAQFRRDEINKSRKPYSLAEVFFKDDSKLNMIKQIGLKIYRRRDI